MKKLIQFIIINIVLVISVATFAPHVISYILEGDIPPQGETQLRFSEISTDFTHQSDFTQALPFMALAAIDINNDGVDEIFVGGGIGQQDAIQAYRNGNLYTLDSHDWFTKAINDPTYGASSIDANNDGTIDLFIARASGLYFYENTGRGFTAHKVDTPFYPNSMPLSIAFGDINKDGYADLYVSNYIRLDKIKNQAIFNRPYGGTSYLLLNNGNGTFANITEASGIYEQHNTFTAVFVDLNNNGHSDLVVAQDTGFVRIFRNNGDLSFDPIDLPLNHSYPMGIAVSDYNNDGLMDLYFSNIGDTLPDFLVRGDLQKNQVLHKDFILLENQGNFQFVDTAKKHDLADYGFGWGLVSYDFNNDSFQDYLVAQNYIRFPLVENNKLYPGTLLQQYSDQKFQPVEQSSGISNHKFGVTTVVSDFNNDGWPDVVIGNLNNPLRAFINQGGSNNWLKLAFKDEARSIGAIATLTLADGSRYTNQRYTSEGLGSDQTSDLFFGLGSKENIHSLTVMYQDGTVLLIDTPKKNSTIDLSQY